MHSFLIISNKLHFASVANEKVSNNKDEASDDKVKIKIAELVKSEDIKKQIPFNLKKIENSKELKKITKFSFAEKTAIILENFDEVTPETANSVLKNLEEPNNNLFYILTAKSIDGVLPTIVSRCEVLTISNKEDTSETMVNKLNYKDLLNIKDRDEAISFIKNLILYDYQNSVYKNIENYLVALKNLKLNGNVSLQLASLLARMEHAIYGKE